MWKRERQGAAGADRQRPFAFQGLCRGVVQHGPEAKLLPTIGTAAGTIDKVNGIASAKGRNPEQDRPRPSQRPARNTRRGMNSPRSTSPIATSRPAEVA